MQKFEARKKIGDAHEERVLREMEARGWTVDQWGQATLKEEIQREVSRTQWAHFPDLVAVRPGELVAIDAKDRMSSADTARYAISRRCVAFGLQFMAAFGIPLFYVLGNLAALTPHEVLAYSTRGAPNLGGGSYHLINERLGHHFDDVFGAPIIREEAA
jgi:hypothetical protein